MQPSTLENTKTEAGVIAALALETLKHEIVTHPSGVPILITAPNVAFRSLERLLAAPLRPTIAVNLTTLQDLHAYIVKHTVIKPLAAEACDTASPVPSYHQPVVFADRNNLHWIAYLDYHHADGPRWLNHTASVKYEHSIQFKTWLDNDGTKMGQSDFAEFLDENVLDIESPTGSDVVSFASCLEARRTEVFKSAKNMANGEVSFIWSNESSGDSQTHFPTEMTLGIPLWTNGEKIALPVKLFYRVDGGALVFWYKLRNVEKIIDALFTADVLHLTEAMTGLGPVYRGTPPATPVPQAL